eukprot:2314951-Lingulodinium_polyedra.AAC.1
MERPRDADEARAAGFCFSCWRRWVPCLSSPAHRRAGAGRGAGVWTSPPRPPPAPTIGGSPQAGVGSSLA